MSALDKGILKDIRAYSLKNALKFEGKASAGAVMGKILAAHPELKQQAKDLGKALGPIIGEVNRMKPGEQRAELEKIAPELLIEEKKETKKDLPELEGAVMGAVVTRIPPEPSKYAHIGHALSFLINYLYAKKYNGRCILKFEDTNPEKCTQEFVDVMTEDILGYLKIQPDEVMLVSDDIPRMYQEAEKLIRKGKAFVCLCPREKMQELRHKAVCCEHRDCSTEENLTLWKKMLDGRFKPGEATLRLVGDMEADNQVMRDPVLFRINNTEHFKHGTKYKAWPMYDFENVVGDCVHGVTHILRSSEFGTMRNELQNRLKDLMGFKRQHIVHYGRINITGAIAQGREIREKIASGEMLGWDDPRLVTLRALKRRGILPEAIHELVYEVGLSLAQTNIDFTVLAAINRRLLDERANRYFFIPYPEKVSIEGAPEQEVRLKLHPEDEKRGYRMHKTHEEFLLTPEDAGALKQGELYRLMDCLNFRKEGKRLVFDSLEYEKYKDRGSRIMHWLPADSELIDIEVLMPTGKWMEGKGEPSMKDINVDDVVQAERFGFMRLDEKTPKKLKFWYTHK